MRFGKNPRPKPIWSLFWEATGARETSKVAQARAAFTSVRTRFLPAAKHRSRWWDIPTMPNRQPKIEFVAHTRKARGAKSPSLNHFATISAWKLGLRSRCCGSVKALCEVRAELLKPAARRRAFLRRYPKLDGTRAKRVFTEQPPLRERGEQAKTGDLPASALVSQGVSGEIIRSFRALCWNHQVR